MVKIDLHCDANIFFTAGSEALFLMAERTEEPDTLLF